MASAAQCAYHLKQLRKFFARANDHKFLEMIWAADALQSDREQAAKRVFASYPPTAADSFIGSPYAIHRWELETLFVQLLLTPKQGFHAGGNLILDCTNFVSMRETINRLRKLEDVESAVYLGGSFNIFNEMHRIAQRQFHWQRGYFNVPQFYRFAYMYAQGQCADYFQAQHGFGIVDLILTSIALFGSHQNVPWPPRLLASPEIGLTEEIIQRAIRLLSRPVSQARVETATMTAEVNEKHGKPIPTAFLPSVLRRYPLISTDENPNLIIAPIPELMLLRVTTGLYYDLIPGGQTLLNEANDRFEQYCADFIGVTKERFAVSRSYRYGAKGAQVDTPDVLVRDKEQVIIAAECKASKLTYLAQFSEDPFEAEKRQYLQIARGVVQLWRFFSDIRRGIAKDELAPQAHALVVTLDPFLMMAREPREKVFQQANALADEHGNITDEDRRPVIICPIYELEEILLTSTEDTFLASLKASYEEKYSGWQLREVHRDSKGAKEFGPRKDFPFDLANVLPWWNRVDEMDGAEEQKASPSE
jgi:hypothetical protein